MDHAKNVLIKIVIYVLQHNVFDVKKVICLIRMEIANHKNHVQIVKMDFVLKIQDS